MSVAHVLCVFFHKDCNESGFDVVKGLLVMHVDVDINDMVKYHIYMLFFFKISVAHVLGAIFHKEITRSCSSTSTLTTWSSSTSIYSFHNSDTHFIAFPVK